MAKFLADQEHGIYEFTRSISISIKKKIKIVWKTTGPPEGKPGRDGIQVCSNRWLNVKIVPSR